MEHKVRVPECAPIYNVFSLYQPPQKPRSKMIMPMLSLLCGMHGFTAKSSVPRFNIRQILMRYETFSLAFDSAYIFPDI